MYELNWVGAKIGLDLPLDVTIKLYTLLVTGQLQ
jgi:hypothetical protein